MALIQTRRGFLGGIAAAGAAGLLGAPAALAAEGVLETPIVRLPKISQSICAAPAYIAGELLRAEGFADIRFVPFGPGDATQAVGGGMFDFALNFASSLTAAIDRGVPITVLAGTMPAASDCLAMRSSVASQISKGGASRWGRWAAPHTSSSLRWLLRSGSIPAPIFIGSRLRAANRSNSLSTAR